MKRFLKYTLFLLAAIAVALVVFHPAKIEQPQKPPAPRAVLPSRKASMEYDVYAAGFKSLHASLKITMDDGVYDAKMSAATQNFIGKLFPWQTSVEATGHVNEKGLFVPLLYAGRDVWRKDTQTSETDYNAEGTALRIKTQEGDLAIEKAVPDNNLSNRAGDVVSASLSLLENAGNTGKCAGKFPVFDGLRRFDITLADDGTEALEPSEYSRFSGEALRCILKVVPVAGYRPKDLKRGWMFIQNYTEQRNKPPLVWLAKLKGSGQMAVVRMQIDSAYGSAIAHLTGSN